MNREKHFHPLAALHLLRKTLLVYLLPLVQVLFDRNWDALRAALRQELVLLFFISAVCWAVYYGGRWQVDAEGTVHVSWRLGVRLDRALRAEGLAALMLEQPLLYRLTGACRVVLYPVGQTKTITLYLTRQQAEELADVLLPVTDPLWHAPKGGEKLAFTVLGANGLSTLILWWLAIHQTQSYAPDAQTAALAQLGHLAAFAALLGAAAVGWHREGVWQQQGQLLLCRQHQFHLHQLCVFHPDTGFTALQSPWAVTVQRANLTLVFPGKEKVTVRSVPLAALDFLEI